MRRKLFTLCSTLSLLLCGIALTMWAKSWVTNADRHRSGSVSPDRRGHRSYEFYSHVGELHLELYWSERRPGFEWTAEELTGDNGPPYLGQRVEHSTAVTRLVREFAPPSAAAFVPPEYVGWGRWEARIRYLTIAAATAVLPAAWGAWWHVRRRRRIRDRARGLCPACGYDLRATLERCPECGAVPLSKAGAAATSS